MSLPKPMSFIITAITMFIFWVLLSGEFDAVLLISAVFSSLLVAYLSHDLLIGGMDIRFCISRNFRFLKYIPWLLWQIVLSNIDVVKRTLHPKMLIDPCLVKVDTNLRSEFGITVFANSITITPGTVTIDANGEGRFLVHAIAREPADGLLGGDMRERVSKIEGWF